MDNNSPKMSNSFNTAFNIVVQICATMIFFSCTSLRNNVYSENKLAKELSAYIVDTVYIDNPSIIEFNDIRYVVDLPTDSISTKNMKRYLNHTVHYVFGDNIYYDLPPHLYEKVPNYPDYGNCDFSVEVQKKHYNILCFKTHPKMFIIVALNVAYFNKKYSSIDTARFIKSYSPLNTYILLAYPLCE